jgi:hypothetical protein
MQNNVTAGGSLCFTPLILALLLLWVSPSVEAAADVSGARDPLGIVRVPDSWIVAYERDDTLKRREYALGRVDRSRRDVRIEHEVRPSASRERATYEMPSGTQTDEVIRHYLEALDTEPLFTCSGRDCGRSNLWANEIFRQAALYGPDANQFYFAGERGDDLVALYVIQRGNKRVYAHLEILKPEREVALDLNTEILEKLAGEGLALVEGVAPDRMGTFDEVDAERLIELAPGLAIFKGQILYVVCHLYGPEPAMELIARSSDCAENAAEQLVSEGGPELVPFGAGPLLPRIGMSARVELVLPHRLPHGS